MALDFLIAFYDLSSNSNYIDSRQEKLTSLQRNFTSIVFQIVRPKDRLEKIKKLTDQYFVKDRATKDIIESP